jgi:hypothetical protein
MGSLSGTTRRAAETLSHDEPISCPRDGVSSLSSACLIFCGARGRCSFYIQTNFGFLRPVAEDQTIVSTCSGALLVLRMFLFAYSDVDI